jgi:hypothetical protein
MISQNTLEKIHKNMLLSHLIMRLHKITLRYHCELLMLFLIKIFIFMIIITKKIKLKKLVKKGLPKDEAKLIHGVVDRSNKSPKLILLQWQQLLLIQFKLNLTFKFMELKNKIKTRNSKIKKSVRKLTISLIAVNLLKMIKLHQ